MNKPKSCRSWYVLVALMIAKSVTAESSCPGRMPDYVTAAADGMVLTQDAEELLCRSDNSTSEWTGEIDSSVIPGQKISIVDKIVRTSSMLKILTTGADIEFLGCIFVDEVFLQGAIESNVTFRNSEFRGNFDVHNARFSQDLRFINSVFHQGIHLADSHLTGQLSFSGSVMAGGIEIEDSVLNGGLRMQGSRVNGNTSIVGLRSLGSQTFDDVRFVGSLTVSGVEILGGVRFRGCDFNRGSLIGFTGGSIGGGINFDSCGFDGQWMHGNGEETSLIRLSELFVGAPVLLAGANSRGLPKLNVSRCIIPFLKLPHWRVAKAMVDSDEGGQLRSPREMEDTAELLQLIRSSYESQGRTRDAAVVRKQHRLLTAQIKGGPEYYLLVARGYFGTGLWWLVGIIGVFAALLTWNGVKWNVFTSTTPTLSRLYRVVDLSISGFFKGPPSKEGSEQALATDAEKALKVERALGIIFMFLFTIMLNEWIRGS